VLVAPRLDELFVQGAEYVLLTVLIHGADSSFWTGTVLVDRQQEHPHAGIAGGRIRKDVTLVADVREDVLVVGRSDCGTFWYPTRVGHVVDDVGPVSWRVDRRGWRARN